MIKIVKEKESVNKVASWTVESVKAKPSVNEVAL
jgi:hypothetical protein